MKHQTIKTSFYIFLFSTTLLLSFLPLTNEQQHSILKKSHSKKPSKKTKNVSFDLSTVSNIVSERSSNFLFRTLNFELTSNMNLFIELINGLLSGFSQKQISIKGNTECFDYLHASYFNKMDKLYDEVIEVFLDDLQMSEIHNPDKRYEVCTEDRKDVLDYVQGKLNYYINQIETVQNEIEEMKERGYDKMFYFDKEFEIEMFETEIARSEMKMKSFEMFPCKDWSQRKNVFIPIPLPIRCEVGLRTLGKFLECYKGNDKDVNAIQKKLKGKVESLVKVGPVLYALLSKKYKFRELGKEYELGKIEEYLSKAQIAEDKIEKELTLLKKKHPNNEEEQLKGFIDFEFKKEVVFNVGAAFGDMIRKVLSVENKK